MEDLIVFFADIALNKKRDMSERVIAYYSLIGLANDFGIDLKYISDDFSDIKIHLSKIK